MQLFQSIGQAFFHAIHKALEVRIRDIRFQFPAFLIISIYSRKYLLNPIVKTSKLLRNCESNASTNALTFIALLTSLGKFN